MHSEHKIKLKPLAVLLICGLSANHSVWASDIPEDKNACQGNMKTIATIGVGLLGAYIGNQIGDGKVGATLIGGALGAWLGNYIGSEIDRRHCELEKIAKTNQVGLTTNEVELKSGIPSQVESMTPGAQQTVSAATSNPTETSGKVDVATWHGMEHFAHGSDVLTPQAVKYFAEAAKQYDAHTAATAAVAARKQELLQQKQQLSDADEKKLFKEVTAQFNLRPIVLVGNTDDTGDSMTNQKLSERRAKAVAQVFRKEGIPASRIYFRGAGEKDPIADNRTEEGRASNRRVEVVELESKEKLDSYIALKSSDVNYYRSQKIASVSGEAATKLGDGSSSQVTAPDVVTSDDNAEQPVTANVASNNKAAKTRKHKTVAKNEEKGSVTTSAPAEAASGGNAEPTVSNKTSLGKEETEKVEPAIASMPASWLDFGGEPANVKLDKGIKKSMGNVVTPGKSIVASATSFLGGMFVKEAQATGNEKVYDLPCTADAPHYGGQYISLETGKAITTHKTSDYSPGLYQTSWTGTVNGHYIGVTPVAVLRDSFEAASSPTLFVYANTDNPSAQTKPSLKIPLAVNVYPGENGILYRMYAEGKSNFVCADVVLPRHAPFTALSGKLYYKRPGQTFENDYTPSMLAGNK